MDENGKEKRKKQQKKRRQNYVLGTIENTTLWTCSFFLRAHKHTDKNKQTGKKCYRAFIMLGAIMCNTSTSLFFISQSKSLLSRLSPDALFF